MAEDIQEATESVELNLDELTLGQIEFMSDYSGLDIAAIQTAFEQKQMTLKLIIAVLALGYDPDDPELGLKKARGIKLSEISDLATAQ